MQPLTIPLTCDMKVLSVDMAIYSCNISNVSRGGGSNACATLSYIAGSKVHCERTNQNFCYGRNERVMAVETLLPKNAPAEYKDPAVLFNAIENYEKSENARTAKKIIVALPREFDSLDSQQDAMREFCSQLTKMGYACTYAIHHDKDNNNPHAHVLIANRPINNKGEFGAKRQKEYVLDEKGERVPVIDKETGKQKLDSRNRKQWKRRDVYTNPLDQKTTLQAIRDNWERVCNKRLEPSQHITSKSHADRGLETEPTIHEGYAAREIERRGGVSDRCELNRAIIYYNRIVNALDFLNKQLAQLLMPKKKQPYRVSHSRRIEKSKELQPERAVRERFVREQRKKKEAEEKAKLEREKEQARQAELERQKQQYQPVYSPPPPTPRRSRGMSR